MPPLNYIHASEAARTTAGGRGVGGLKLPPPIKNETRLTLNSEGVGQAKLYADALKIRYTYSHSLGVTLLAFDAITR